MSLIEKVENAISILETEKISETEIILTFSELKGIRAHLLIDELSMKLSRENIRSGQKFSKTLTEKI